MDPFTRKKDSYLVVSSVFQENTPLSLALNTQGVNLGFGDVASLASCVEDSLREGGRLGQREYLAQYETERQEGGQA